jgi:hypothetical protein
MVGCPVISSAAIGIRLKRCAILLLEIALVIVMVDCSPRHQDYGWDEAPRAESCGVAVVVRDVSRSGGQIQATLYVRDLTDKDCFFQQLQAGDDSSWLTANWGQERIQGSVRLVGIATPQHDQAFQRTFSPLSGAFHVQAHSSRILAAEFARSAFSDLEGPWTIHVVGHWSEGGAVSLDIAIPALTTQYPYPDGVPVYAYE